MDNIINDIDELIGKYLAQETTPSENLLVENWITKSDSNKRYFDQVKVIFDRAANVKQTPDFNTDEAWKNLKTRLTRKPEAKTIFLKPSNPSQLFWRIAASVLLLLGIGFFTYKLAQPDVSSVEVISEKKIEIDTLPDGSEVFLNKETRLTYSFNKKEKVHRVKLKGEAFFKIQHEDKKDFVIDAEGVFIKDIGTSFNVKAYPNSNTIEVDVQDGEVKLYTENSDGISLHAGDKGVYNKGTRTFSTDRIEPNVIAYKTKYFVFSNTDLGSVVDQLNNIYESQIIVDDKLRNCRLTVTFNNETIDEIANVIAETLGLTVSRSGDQIVLEGVGCE